MKSAHVAMAARALAERDRLIGARAWPLVDIHIAGERQDDEMAAAVRPAIVSELDRRIAALDADLVAWGVEPPGAQPC